tara:strand:+ start:1242 stop:1940 length:699 start_codon:yes stop_codon:yes gene_type:complete
MKIGVFAYNFKHWKTQQGIQNLILAGYKPEVILAADPVQLNFYQSKIRVSPKDLYLVHPKEIADRYEIPYKVVVHNSQETSDIVKNLKLDLGIILGARILKPIAFENFTYGVLNMHPGMLPENRGLDNIKWAILDDKQQGVTVHLIDETIDRGKLLIKESIKIYKDDTLVDLNIRIQNLEQRLMIECVNNIESFLVKNNPLGQGTYYKAVPADIEQTLLKQFNRYKEKWAEK